MRPIESTRLGIEHIKNLFYRKQVRIICVCPFTEEVNRMVDKLISSGHTAIHYDHSVYAGNEKVKEVRYDSMTESELSWRLAETVLGGNYDIIFTTFFKNLLYQAKRLGMSTIALEISESDYKTAKYICCNYKEYTEMLKTNELIDCVIPTFNDLKLILRGVKLPILAKYDPTIKDKISYRPIDVLKTLIMQRYRLILVARDILEIEFLAKQKGNACLQWKEAPSFKRFRKKKFLDQMTSTFETNEKKFDDKDYDPEKFELLLKVLTLPYKVICNEDDYSIRTVSNLNENFIVLIRDDKTKMKISDEYQTHVLNFINQKSKITGYCGFIWVRMASVLEARKVIHFETQYSVDIAPFCRNVDRLYLLTSGIFKDTLQGNFSGQDVLIMFEHWFIVKKIEELPQYYALIIESFAKSKKRDKVDMEVIFDEQGIIDIKNNRTLVITYFDEQDYCMYGKLRNYTCNRIKRGTISSVLEILVYLKYCYENIVSLPVDPFDHFIRSRAVIHDIYEEKDVQLIYNAISGYSKCFSMAWRVGSGILESDVYRMKTVGALIRGSKTTSGSILAIKEVEGKSVINDVSGHIYNIFVTSLFVPVDIKLYLHFIEVMIDIIEGSAITKLVRKYISKDLLFERHIDVQDYGLYHGYEEYMSALSSIEVFFKYIHVTIKHPMIEYGRQLFTTLSKKSKAFFEGNASAMYKTQKIIDNKIDSEKSDLIG